MKATFKIDQPKDIEMTLTITMPLAKWIALADRIGDEWPGSEFSALISQMVRHACKHFADGEGR